MNTRTVVVAFIALILGIGCGYIAPRFISQRASMAHDQKDAAAHSAGMSHPILEAVAPIPTIALAATPDSKDGYNVHITTTNFSFTPEKVGLAAVANEGHAHLFVNGHKISRLYDSWYHLSTAYLKAGENIVEVTLNANDHSEWTVGGEHIAAQVIITK